MQRTLVTNDRETLMSEQTLIAARAGAASISLLAASALRSTLEACARIVNEREGTGFDLNWGTSGAINQRVKAGEMFDLVASARDALLQLHDSHLLTGEVTSIGVSRLALGIREGESAPDVSTAQKFRDVLLNASMISRGDPAGGGTAGNHLVKVFEQLEVTQAVAQKSILRAGGFAVMSEVAEGRADFGLTQSTEIPAVKGVKIGAFLPAEVQLETVYAIAACEKANAAAQQFMTFLKSEEAGKIIAGAGFASV
jgi:molybdate transport system substrate-binding protein